MHGDGDENVTYHPIQEALLMYSYHTLEMWLVPKELIFKFYVMLIRLNLNRHVWLVTTIKTGIRECSRVILGFRVSLAGATGSVPWLWINLQRYS